MRESKLIIIMFLAVSLALLAAPDAYAQYWFQSGANGGGQSQYNTGASGYIETVYPQYVSYGSYGFWIGETLNNNAFVQVGYEITNTSGYYPQECGPSGCNGSVYIAAGYPTWFWEYFQANYSGTGFYGGIGPNDSVGLNGTFNEYSFMLNGSTWDFYFNNQLIGSAVNLGTSNSGINFPAAYAELANANTNQDYMSPVMFKNISYYKDGSLHLLDSGYSYIGYGKNSSTSLRNPYGVVEVKNRADFFSVGSGLPILLNGTALWKSAYRLDVSSQYGNATGSGYYSTFSDVRFSVPRYVSIGNGTRAAFAGWVGEGPGSYTGPSNSSSVFVSGNISETALWNVQYYVNASSPYGTVSGNGWYSPGTIAAVSINTSIVNLSRGTREVFSGWSNGATSESIDIVVNKPEEVAALWNRQYFLGLSTPYGAARGAGWYNSGSRVNISLSQDYFNQTEYGRIAFYSWSGVYNQSSAQILLNSSVNLTAIFKQQYLAALYPQNAGGQPLHNVTFYLSNGESGTDFMLFSGEKYAVTGAFYKGVKMGLNYFLNLSSPGSFYIRLPVYNLNISARSLLNAPLNASVYASFSNGSETHMYLGMGGTALLRNVPFGRIYGYMQYGFITEAFSSTGGSNVSLIIITPAIFALIIAVIAGMYIGLLLHRKMMRKETVSS